MAHPHDKELIPLGAVVKIVTGTHKGKKARIKDYTFQFNGRGFLNYLGYIQGKGKNLYALYHEDLEIEKT